LSAIADPAVADPAVAGTLVGTDPGLVSWREPDGVAPRGTLVVVPGRGEHAGVYERFGRRLAADGYRVWAVADPTVAQERTAGQIRALLDAEDAGPLPRVLVGSDAGALFAAGLVAGGLAGVAGLVLAGMPTAADAGGRERPDAGSWEEEVAARTACPTHRARLDGDRALRRGALHEQPPGEWFTRAQAGAVRVPVLGLHGVDDPISPLAAARTWYAGLPAAELVTIGGGRHDALNDQTHRTAAASVVLYLERLRLGPDLPVIARTERPAARR
jgi:alpha-beta hydrolase superfamily lysophospholipase